MSVTCEDGLPHGREESWSLNRESHIIEEDQIATKTACLVRHAAVNSNR